MLNPQETSQRSLPVIPKPNYVTWVAENTFLLGPLHSIQRGCLINIIVELTLLGRKKMQLGIFVQRANSISSWSSASGMLSCRKILQPGRGRM